MGYYIPTGVINKGKADVILGDNPGAREVNVLEAQAATMAGEGVVVVLDNGPFEAAGFAYSLEEFGAFTEPDDPRPKRFIVMPYEKAAELAGYPI